MDEMYIGSLQDDIRRLLGIFEIVDLMETGVGHGILDHNGFSCDLCKRDRVVLRKGMLLIYDKTKWFRA